MEPAEAAGAEQRMDGGRNRVKEEEGRLSSCLLRQTLNRLEGVQGKQCNCDSLFQMQNIKDLLIVIKSGKHTVDYD